MTNRFNMAAVSALVLLLGTTSALAVDFGSDNGGLAGFTTSIVDPDQESWSIQPGSVRYINDDPDGIVDSGIDGAIQNASLLRDYTLDRSVGSSYTIEGVVHLTDGYADDNNRVGIYLFGDGPDVTSEGSGLEEDELGALSVLINFESGSFRIMQGIDRMLIAEANHGRAQDVTWFGEDIKISVDATFNAANIDISATLIDGRDNETTVNTSVIVTDYTGDYFGFATRSRNRGISSSDRNAPFTMDYKSFSVIPEPASMALIGLFTAGIWFKRRFFMD